MNTAQRLDNVFFKLHIPSYMAHCLDLFYYFSFLLFVSCKSRTCPIRVEFITY
jgi:hypothetical protein